MNIFTHARGAVALRVLLLVLLGIPALGRAALLAYEPFDTVGGVALAGANSSASSGFNGNWVNNGNFTASTGTSSLNYPPSTAVFTPIGKCATQGGTGTSQGDYYRTLGSTFGDSQGAQTVWMSFLMNSQGRAYNGFLYLNSTSGFQIGTGWTGAGASGIGNYSVFRNSGSGGTTTGNGGQVPLNTTKLLVVKLTFSGDSNVDTARLFINPANGPAPTDSMAVSTLTGLNFGDIDRVGMHWGAPSTLDEIRIGTTYGDVVPEPQTWMAMGLGALGLIRQRKRRAN